jgi:hypothetical protein
MNNPWIGLVGVVLGAALGYVAGELRSASDRRRQKRGLLMVLRSDVSRNLDMFNAYRRDQVAAPAYRMAVGTWDAAVPFLAALDVFTIEHIRVLARFFAMSSELNYCLERIADAAKDSFEREVNRANLKVSNVLDPQQLDGETVAPVSDRALAAIQSACEKAGVS